MKFYLSSYKLGNKTKKLKQLLQSVNKKAAYIPNALDFSNDIARRNKSEQSDMDELKKLELDVEVIDLRDYFNKQNKLRKKIAQFGVIWVRGGNLFVLRQAMKLSGFDAIVKSLNTKKNILYGGYSAGVCILAPTLKGMDLMDDKSIKPYKNQSKTIWDGLGIIDYSIIPHYQSNHPESKSADEAVRYMIDHKILFKVLKDEEVIIIP